MNGVMIPGVSAGSKLVGASVVCTAQVSCPSGAAPAGAAASNTTARARPANRPMAPHYHDDVTRTSSSGGLRNVEWLRDYPRTVQVVNCFHLSTAQAVGSGGGGRWSPGRGRGYFFAAGACLAMMSSLIFSYVALGRMFLLTSSSFRLYGRPST